MHKKLFAILVLATLIVSSITISIAGNVVKDDAFYGRQMESIEAYNELLLAMEDDDELKAIFCDAYIDDNAELVVLLIEETDKNKEKIKEKAIKVKKFSKGKIPLAEVEDVMDALNNGIELFLASGYSVNSIEYDIFKGEIRVNINEINGEVKKILDGITDKKYVKLVKSNVVDIPEATDLKGGYGIKSQDNNAFSTLGFGATRNGVDGVVIAGHAGDKYLEGFEYNGTAIGAVTKDGLHNGSYADASFVTTTTAFNSTNKLVPGNVVGKQLSALPYGTTVLMYGNGTGGYLSGTIHLTNYTSSINGDSVYDQTVAKYDSSSGDSGGPVFISNSSGDFIIVGIHSAEYAYNSSYGVYSKYSNIASELGIIAKIN